VSFDESAVVAADKGEVFIALDDALLALEEIDPRKCRIVEMRYFGGLSVEETAVALKISSRTVLRVWNFARAWLRNELSK
jgi:RNA polymerase sigma factor (sigma-70 family)